MTPEGKIKQKVKELLKKYPVWYTMTIPSAFGNSTGVPDFTCVVPTQITGIGAAFFIETKAPGKKPTPLQAKTMNDLERHGAKCFVVDSDNSLTAVRQWLDGVAGPC